ncbi:hypothetical protein [Gordonia sp. N1V]|uniref:hypothetical protein n=1 Tax=Gordonia sp. N1V TaxID=3034163 RepID=UPI0023E181B4|nr:hypothetical protein [Gordonia sp. N1V]MDF3280938.1 hypothetical protein [Gordonia sp. N1V]
MTEVDLSTAVAQVVPETNEMYYVALGLGGLVGCSVTFRRASDSVRVNRRRLITEAFALATTGGQWLVFAAIILRHGQTTSFQTGALAISVGLAAFCRIGQIVVDLKAIDAVPREFDRSSGYR